MYPKELKYHKEHTWAEPLNGNAKIGITDFAQESLGDIVYIELPSVGDEVVADESLGEVESTKAVSKIYAPISGKVVAVNDNVVEAPETLNEDMYEEGWLIEIEVSDSGELENLMTADEYESYIAEKS